MTNYDPFAPEPIAVNNGGGTGAVGPSGPVAGGGAPQRPAPGVPFQQTDQWGQPTAQWVVYDANGNLGPYRAPTQSAGDTSAQVDGAGVPYVIRGGRGFTLDGQPYTPVALATNPHPGTSYSYGSSNSTSQSFQDPAALQIQRDQLAAQQAQQAAALAEQIRLNTATLKQKDVDLALQQRLAAFNENEAIFGRSIKNAELAERAQTRLDANRQNMAALEMQKVQLQTSIAAQNAQLQQAHERDVMQFEADKQRRLTEANASIGKLAADPGDRGVYTGTVLANSGWGQTQGALAATDQRTGESLQPLAGQLNNRDQIAASQAPAMPSLIPTPDLTGINLAALGANGSNNPNLAADQARAAAMAAAINTPAAQASQGTVEGGTPASPAQGGIDLAALIGGNTSALTGAGYKQTPAMKSGGMVQGAYVSGDAPGPDPSAGGARPELNIPLPDGKTAVLNEKQMDALGINLKRIMKLADGGIFASPLLDTTRAREFSDETARRTLTNTGLQQAPAPVFSAGPNADPFVTQLLDSVFAASGHGPAGAYTYQANLLRPRGMMEQTIGRTG